MMKNSLRAVMIAAAAMATTAMRAQTTIATFENGDDDMMTVDTTAWYDAKLFSAAPRVYDNPQRNGVNTSRRCAGARNVADADWWGNFMVLRMKTPVTISEDNRYLTFMAYRSAQPKEMRIGLNGNDEGSQVWLGRLDNDSTWQTVTVDLGANNMGKTMRTINIVLSCNWSDPRTGWGEADYYFDNFVMSSADVILDEDASYKNPESPTNVSIVELKRTFAKNWNTLCLPVSLTQEQIKKVFGDSTLVAHFSGFDGANIKFSAARQTINANEPVLIKPEKTDINCYFVSDVTVSPVTLPSNTMKITKGGETLSFVGNYDPIENLTSVGAAGEDVYYAEGTNAYKLDAGSTIAQKAFRAYFKSTNAATEKTTLVVDDIPTSIQAVNVQKNVETSGRVYDISGRLVSRNASVESLSKGLYIVNGKKVIVK